jgi:hypothetical protein
LTRIARSAHLEDQNLTGDRTPPVELTVAARLTAGAAPQPHRQGARRSAYLRAAPQGLAWNVTRLPPSAMQVTLVC